MWPSWDIALLVFAAGLMEGAAGFDFGLMAAPALGAILGVRDSVLALSLPNLVLLGVRAAGGGVPAASLRRLAPFLGAGAAGASLGVLILVSSPPTFLKWSVGALALLFAAHALSRRRIQLDTRDEAFFTWLAGFFAGGLSGFSFSGGPLSVIYLDSAGVGRARMMRLVCASALAFAVVQVAALGGAGALGIAEAARSAACVPPALAGFAAGRLLRGRLPPALGYAGGLALMTAAGLALLIFGPSGWK